MRDFGAIDERELQRELSSLRCRLMGQFKDERWSELAGTLDTLARVGEGQGERELCLRAQGLRELMGGRAGGRAEPGARVQELFSELMFRLGHLQWTCQVSR